MTRPYHWTEEGLAKRRAAMKRAWADPEVKAKHRAALKGRPDALPDFSLDERRIYTKLRANGVARDDAIREALRGAP